MLFSFSLNGIKKDYMICGKGKRRSAFAPITRNLLTIPGLAGALLDSTETEVRVIEQPIYIKGKDRYDVRKLEEDLAAWLITEEAQELIFDDEPDRIYYALVDGSLDIEDIVHFGQGTITFICPDPYKYGEEKYVDFTNAASILVDGTVKTEPIIELDIMSDTTFVAISDGDKINMIGNPVKQEEVPFEAEIPILIHTGNNLTGWTDSAEPSLEGTPQTGTLLANGNFYVNDYGTDSGWHGPAKKTSLSEPLQDFRFDVGMNLRKTGPNQAGAIRVSLLDASSRIVAHVFLTKHYGEMDMIMGRVRAGTKDIGAEVLKENYAEYLGIFSGVIRVYRRGNEWLTQVFYLRDGKFLSPINHGWIDNEGIASATVTQVQVRLLQRANFPVVEQNVADIQVYKLNNPTDGQIPIIARAGDKVIFDHQNDIIRLNGLDITKEKAFIGDYFSLQPGQNSIAIEPRNAITNSRVRWKNKCR